MSIVGDIANDFYMYYIEHEEYNPLPEIFVSPLQAYEKGIYDNDDAPKKLSTKLVKWIENKKTPKPIIATRTRVIAYAFSEKLSSIKANKILQSYGFSGLYERSFIDATIIFALDNHMSVSEWKILYREYLKDYSKISKDYLPEVKFGFKDLSDRDFYRLITEIGELPETTENVINQMTVDIYELALENSLRQWAASIGKQTLKVVNRIFKNYSTYDQKINTALSVLMLSKKYSPERMETACTFAQKNDISTYYLHLKTFLASEQEEDNETVKLESTKDNNDVTDIENTFAYLLNTRIKKEEQIQIEISAFFHLNVATYASLDNIPSIITPPKKNSIINRTDVYRTVANHLVLSSDNIHTLYTRLMKNASSLLDEVALKNIFLSTDDLEECYKKLHPYFTGIITLQQLWEMLEKYSERDSLDNLVTLKYTQNSIKPELTQAISNDDFLSFYNKYSKEMAETRYKKRRCVVKDLHCMLKDRYLELLNYQEIIIKIKEIKKREKHRDKYLQLVKNTLIKGLPKKCGVVSKNEDKEVDNRKEQTDQSPYMISKINQDNKLTMEILQNMPVSLKRVYREFSFFCGHQNNIDKRFIQNYNVMIYNEQNGLFDDGYAAISLPMANNTTLVLEYNRKKFIYQYGLNDASDKIIYEVFYKELSKCVRAFDKMTAETLKQLIHRSNRYNYNYEDDLEYDSSDTEISYNSIISDDENYEDLKIADEPSSKQLYVNMDYIRFTGCQSKDATSVCYALAYCKDILDNKPHSADEYLYHTPSSSKGESVVKLTKAGYSSHIKNGKKAVLQALIKSINDNKPAIVKVVGNNLTEHYLCVVGYKNISDTDKITEGNFLIIDSSSQISLDKGITQMSNNDSGYSIHPSNQYYTKIDSGYTSYQMFVNILNGSSDSSREFLLLFSLFCGASKDEIINHLLPNAGYSTLLPKSRMFDRLITDLCKFDNVMERRLTLDFILDHLETSTEETEEQDDNNAPKYIVPKERRSFGLHQIIYDTAVGEEIVK